VHVSIFFVYLERKMNYAFLNLKFQHIYMANKEDESKKSINHVWFDKEQYTINHMFRTNLKNVKYWPNICMFLRLCSYHFNNNIV